ncbi:SIMPL domain-containing protein [Amnimonas aquatica]|nr:SIMPL domain-containing protein [Amnimonas aquatica]
MPDTTSRSNQPRSSTALLFALILAAGTALGGALIAGAIRDARHFDQAVEVRGLAEQVVKSDQASWQLGFTTFGADAAGANKAWAEKVAALEAQLRAAGFADSEIRRQPLSLFDSYGNGGNLPPANQRFRANGGVLVETADVDKVDQASRATDAFVAAGVVLDNSYVRYFFTDLNRIKPAMLKAATANAREAADTFAKDSGVKVGGIKSATQGLFSISSPVSDYDAESSLMKKVRVVTRVQFFIE